MGSGSARVAFANTAAGTLTELRDLAVTAGRESDASGGGLWLEGPGSYALERIALYDNRASSTIGSARGGAIVKRGTGSLTIRSTLISGNRVTTTGPGSDYATGGAIYHQSGSLTVENTTFSHNEAHGVSGAHAQGGGVYPDSGATLRNVTLADSTVTATTGQAAGANPAVNFGTATVENSIIAWGAGTDGATNCAIGGGTFAVDRLGPQPRHRHLLRSRRAQRRGSPARRPGRQRWSH